MSLAFVFPGQGSQSVGMLADLAAAHPVVEETFAQASAQLGYDLWDLVQNDLEQRLNQTAITQPAMLTAGVATWRVWESTSNNKPVVMAGHSLGEYTALVCAGAINFEDAVNLVAERGRLMQEAVPAGEGAMAAILGLDDDVVIDTCDRASLGDVVSAVNFNAPGQVVIAGHKAAVERAVEIAKQEGAKRAVILPVSVPSHCSLMMPAAELLMIQLKEIGVVSPAIPVINNVDVRMEADPAAIRKALARQLYSPVRWVETIQTLYDDGIDQLIECGPGKVLAGLNKRIERDMAARAVFDNTTLQAALDD